VRRIVRGAESGRVVGLSLLNGELQAVTLEHVAGPSGLRYAVEGYVVDEIESPAGLVSSCQAILVRAPEKPESLLMESANYAHGRHYALRADNASLRSCIARFGARQG